MKKYYRPDIQQQRQDILNRMYGFTHGPNFVYALVKNIERKRSPIYVGETVDPRRRFQQHLKVAYGGREDHSVVGKLERRIVASGGKLEMYCLEACQNRISALSKEAAWARALSSSGCTLANVWPEHQTGSNVVKVPIERIKLLNLKETLALGIGLKLKCNSCALQIDLPVETLKSPYPMVRGAYDAYQSRKKAVYPEQTHMRGHHRRFSGRYGQCQHGT